MFITESLQQAYELNKVILDNISTNLDKVTNEINTLEKYLKDANLLDSFAHYLSVNVEHRLTTFNNNNGERETAKLFFIVRKGLLWENKIKKILYFHQEFNHQTDDPRAYKKEYLQDKVAFLDSVGGWDDATTDNGKPLLETKFQTRKEVLPLLPGFLKAIAQQYNIFNIDVDPPNNFDDLPF